MHFSHFQHGKNLYYLDQPLGPKIFRIGFDTHSSTRSRMLRMPNIYRHLRIDIDPSIDLVFPCLFTSSVVYQASMMRIPNPFFSERCSCGVLVKTVSRYNSSEKEGQG